MGKQILLGLDLVGKKVTQLFCIEYDVIVHESKENKSLISSKPTRPFVLFIIKGALDNILKFYFWLNFIYHVKCNC